MSGERKQDGDHHDSVMPGEVRIDLEADAAVRAAASAAARAEADAEACCQLCEHQLHCYGLLLIVCGVLLVIMYELVFPLLSGRQ